MTSCSPVHFPISMDKTPVCNHFYCKLLHWRNENIFLHRGGKEISKSILLINTLFFPTDDVTRDDRPICQLETVLRKQTMRRTNLI